MKKYLLLSVSLLLAALTSCKYASQLTDAVTGLEMDGESTYTKVAELVGEVDPAWKVYYLSVDSEGMDDQCRNTVGVISVRIMNAEGEAYRQNLYPAKSQPSIDSFAPKGVAFDELPVLDFTAEKAMKNINDCKAMIPEGYKFLNLNEYLVEYKSESNGFVTRIVINMQEVGKESVNVNGSESGVYYQLSFTITPDGNIEMKES